MTDETLSELLRRLREHLNSSGSIEPESRDLLARTMRDISARLSAGQVAADAKGADVDDASGEATVASTPVSVDARVASGRPDSMESSLEQLAVRFEAKHPSVAESLRQLGALLAQAGI